MQKILTLAVLAGVLMTSPVYAAGAGKSTAEDSSVGVNNNVGVNAAGIGVGVGAGVNADLPDTRTRVRSGTILEQDGVDADSNAGLDDSEE